MQDFHLNIVVNQGGGNGVSCAPPNSESCTKDVQGSQACVSQRNVSTQITENAYGTCCI